MKKSNDLDANELKQINDIGDFLQRFKEDPSEFYNALMQLQDGTTDVDLKTEYHKPRAMAVLFVLVEYLAFLELPFSSALLESFGNHYSRNMVSFLRKSRQEVISAIQQLRTKVEERFRIEETKK